MSFFLEMIKIIVILVKKEMSKLIAKNYQTLHLDDISCSKKSFINFQSETLMSGLPASLEPENVVVELVAGRSDASSLLDMCKHVKKWMIELL
jgi:EAL and modified HD-GYP domain-containing signal transduction protein